MWNKRWYIAIPVFGICAVLALQGLVNSHFAARYLAEKISATAARMGVELELSGLTSELGQKLQASSIRLSAKLPSGMQLSVKAEGVTIRYSLLKAITNSGLDSLRILSLELQLSGTKAAYDGLWPGASSPTQLPAWFCDLLAIEQLQVGVQIDGVEQLLAAQSLQLRGLHLDRPEQLAWELAQVTATNLDPGLLLPQPETGRPFAARVSLEFASSGRLAAWELSGQTTVHSLAVGGLVAADINIVHRLSYQGQRLSIDELRLEAETQKAYLQGSLEFTDLLTAFKLTGDSDRFIWQRLLPEQIVPGQNFRVGISTQGTGAPAWQVRTKLTIADLVCYGQQLDLAELELHYQGDKLELRHGSLRGPLGSAEGRAVLVPNPSGTDQSGSYNLQQARISLNLEHPEELDSRLLALVESATANLELSGPLKSPDIQLELALLAPQQRPLLQLRGQLQSTPVQGYSWHNAQVSLQLGDQRPYQPWLQQLPVSWQSVTGQASFAGALKSPAGQYELIAEQTSYDQLTIGRIAASGSFAWAAGTPSLTAQVEAIEIALPELLARPVQQASLNLELSTAGYRVTLTDLDQLAITGRVAGRFAASMLECELKIARLPALAQFFPEQLEELALAGSLQLQGEIFPHEQPVFVGELLVEDFAMQGLPGYLQGPDLRVQGQVLVDDQQLFLDKCRLKRTDGAEVWASGSIGYRAPYAFDLGLEVAGYPLAKLVEFLPADIKLVSGHGQAVGRLGGHWDALTVALQASSNDAVYYEDIFQRADRRLEHLELKLQVDSTAITIAPIRVVQYGQTLTGSFRYDLPQKSWRLDLLGPALELFHWQADLARYEITSCSGQGSLSGSISQVGEQDAKYELSLRVRNGLLGMLISGEEHHLSALEFRGRYQKDLLLIDQLQGRYQQLPVTLQGELELATPDKYILNLATASLVKDSQRWQLPHPARISYADSRWQIEAGALQSLAGELFVAGDYDSTAVDLELEFRELDLATALQALGMADLPLAGVSNFKGTAGGNPAALQLAGRYDFAELRYESAALPEITGQVLLGKQKLQLTGAIPIGEDQLVYSLNWGDIDAEFISSGSQAHIETEGIDLEGLNSFLEHWGVFLSGQLEFSVQGRVVAQELQLQGFVRGANVRLDYGGESYRVASLEGHFSGPQLAFKIVGLRYQESVVDLAGVIERHNGHYNFSLENLSGQVYGYPINLLRPVSGSFDQQALINISPFSIETGYGLWDVRYDLKRNMLNVAAMGFDLQRLARVWHHLVHLRGKVDINIDIVPSKEDWAVKGQVSGSDIRYQLLEFSKVNLDFNYSRGHLFYISQLLSSPAGFISASGLIPVVAGLQSDSTLGNDERVPRWHHRLTVSNFNLSALNILLPDIRIDQGLLGLNIALSGSPQSPVASGSYRVDSTNIYLPMLDQNLLGVAFVGLVSTDQVTITGLTGSLGGGKLSGGGQILHKGLLPQEYDFKLQLADWVYDVIPDLLLISDLEVAIGGSFEQPVVTGECRIKRGLFTRSFGERIPRFYSLQSQKISTTKSYSLDIGIGIENDFWIKNEEANIEVGGQLRYLNDQGREDLSGVLKLQHGGYYFYGQRFEIDTGELVFPGEMSLDPLLAVKADTKIQGTLVSILLNGSIEKPIVRFSSQPTYSQEEILTLLITGRRLGQGADLGEAGSARAVGAFTNLATRNLQLKIEERTKLDTFEFSTGLSESGNFQLQGVKMGKYMTEKLFVSYYRPLSGTTRDIYRFEYKLPANMMIESETESRGSSYADLLYKLRFE